MFSKQFGFPQIAFEGEGNGGGGTPPAPATPPAAPVLPESVLFPNDPPKVDPATPPAGDPAKVDPPAEWKEYEPDATKTPEENAAAKAEHDAAKPKADDPLDKVPEGGKYELKMPDGIETDNKLLEALGPKFAAKNMTTREAQELADEFIKVEQAKHEEKMTEWGKTLSGWVETAQKDPEIGGTKWDATKAACQRAVNTLGNPALKEYLDASGGGNHPELIRIFAKVGAMIKEDNPANGGAGGSGSPVDPAHRLFPNDAPKGK